MEVAGRILECEYENGERYRLLFGIRTITWKCLAGSVAGTSGTDSYGAIKIAPNLFLISWSLEGGEVLSMVADFQKDIMHCCRTHEDTRHFWKGNIERFAKPAINRADLF